MPRTYECRTCHKRAKAHRPGREACWVFSAVLATICVLVLLKSPGGSASEWGLALCVGPCGGLSFVLAIVGLALSQPVCTFCRSKNLKRSEEP